MAQGQSLPRRDKQVASENLGNITGRRGAGMTSVGGGDQLLHAFSHYGKDAPPLVTDMVGPPMRPGRGPIRGI